MNQVTELLQKHVSIRKYKDKQLEREMVEILVDCAQMASTSSHYQSYTMIEVQKKEGREALFAASGGQAWVLSAPLVMLFCGDLKRADKYFQGIDKRVLGNTECYTFATIDASLAAQNMLIAAESLGLGGVFVGGIRNDVESVARAFKLPPLVFPLFALCIGWPDDAPGIKPRLPKEVVRKFDFYDETKDDGIVGTYNQAISEYYDKRTGGEKKDDWSQHSGCLMMAKTRYEVGRFFRKHGLLQE